MNVKEKENWSKQMKQLVVRFEDIIRNTEMFYAHVDDENHVKKPELLKEHVDRCLYYFQRICQAKNLELILGDFEKELLGVEGNHYGKLFKKMLVNTIAFHDMGKINPQFQKIKMKNEKVENLGSQIQCLEGSKHSLLSAAIYVDYFLAEIGNCTSSKQDAKTLRTIMLANAYVISRHHSDLSTFQEFLDQFGNEVDEVVGQEGRNGTADGKLHAIFEELREGKFEELYCGPFSMQNQKIDGILRMNKRSIAHFNEQQNSKFVLYTYVRFIYSLLISCDYYATSEYESGERMSDFGNIKEIMEINQCYERGERIKGIREFQRNPREDENDINVLRNEMFLEAEKNLFQSKSNHSIFFLEAPTGGGKSNIAMNCSFKLLDEQIRKIIYVYPFNTLIEQNMDTLKDVFGETNIFNQIAVLNSITPIKCKNIGDFEDDPNEEESKKFYQKALLDRQFWNYPFILTTHVTLFQTMFGTEKGAAISFYQLANSVVVLDEIQSYRNAIWTEVMLFLEQYSRLLNMKIIIMSATLPHLNQLTNDCVHAVELIKGTSKYFEDQRFCKRVKISYELLYYNRKTEEKELLGHILKHAGAGVKILVEFISKKRAENFYSLIKEAECDEYTILCMTGDDNQIDRAHILNKIKNSGLDKGVILIATQVVEAGVDIDMDIGYKDISKLDSDEQFLGRINRNFRREGIVYFFNMDRSESVYHDDYRMDEQYTLYNDLMKTVLEKKDFSYYYGEILKSLRRNRNNCFGENGIETFFDKVQGLDFKNIEERMYLIEDNQRDVSVFLNRDIWCDDGTCMKGKEIWEQYKELLRNQEMEYAEKQIQLSIVRSKMNFFIYRLKKNSNLVYHGRIGELYYIEDAEKYFENNRLNKSLLVQNGALFIEI